MSNTDSSSTTLVPSTSLSSETSTGKPLFSQGSSFILGVAAASFLVLLLLIFAICKYRNRDEGTYRIDETKNFGPFAELDAPLNGTSKKTSNNKNNRRKGVGVKEWYV